MIKGRVHSKRLYTSPDEPTEGSVLFNKQRKMIEQSQVAGDQPLEESTDQATPEDQVNDQAEEAVTPSTDLQK